MPRKPPEPPAGKGSTGKSTQGQEQKRKRKAPIAFPVSSVLASNTPEETQDTGEPTEDITQGSEAPNLGGRPFSYTPEIFNEMMAAIATSTHSLRTICATHDNFPDVSSFYRWLIAFPELREHYARAKEDQLQTLEDEMRDIADDSVNDYMMTAKGMMPNKEMVQRSKLRIETRQWLMGKLRPKKYGDKLDVEAKTEVVVRRVISDI